MIRQLILDSEQHTRSLAEQFLNDRAKLKERLFCDGSIGLDLSPGDPISFAAHQTIVNMEREIAALEATVLKLRQHADRSAINVLI